MACFMSLTRRRTPWLALTCSISLGLLTANTRLSSDVWLSTKSRTPSTRTTCNYANHTEANH